MINIISFIRDIMAAGILLMSLIPATSKKIIFIPVIFSWFIFAYFSKNKSFTNTFLKPSLKSYCIYVWVLSYLLFYLIGYAVGIDAYIFNFIQMSFLIIMINYYIEADEFKAMNKLIVIALSIISGECLYTISILNKNNDAARLLATGREELTRGISPYIGSYGFIYGLIFICIVILGCFMNKSIKKNKILWILILIILWITIIKASFMISLILLITISLLIILKVNKVSTFLILCLLIIILVNICLPFISHGLILLSSSINSQSMSVRLYELNQFITNGSTEGTIDMSARVNLYMISVKSFISNPLIGVGGFYGYNMSNFGIGGHSAFFDEIARYGILGTMPLFVGLYQNMNFIYERLDEKHKKIYFKCIIAFFILGFINTLFIIPLITIVFFVVPGVLFYLENCIDLNKNT